MSDIGTRIHDYRTAMGLSMSELAKLSDISKGYLHAIESGKTQNPSGAVLSSMAHQLGITVDHLLGNSLDSNAIELTPSQRQLINAMNRHDYVRALRIVTNAMDDHQNGKDILC